MDSRRASRTLACVFGYWPAVGTRQVSLPWDWRPHRSKRFRSEFRAAIAYIRSGSAAIVIFPTK
jgi:hypothetical protein